MGIFGDDPKDQTIALQHEEIRYLRAKVDELQKELLAMTSASAYRLVHSEPDAPPEHIGPPALSPAQLRDAEPIKPDKTIGEMKAAYGPGWGENES